VTRQQTALSLPDEEADDDVETDPDERSSHEFLAELK
jgi:hypothetical protein